MRIKQYEQKALEYLLAGNKRLFQVLRNQSKSASVSRRRRTDDGILAYFKVPESIDRLKRQPTEFYISDVMAEAVNVDIPFDFTLCVKNGSIHYLQSYAYGDCWPQDAEHFSYSYMKESPAGSGRLYKSDSRDWDYVERMIKISDEVSRTNKQLHLTPR